MSDIEYQTEILVNRIQKRYKHLKKWAKRTGVFSFRLYDKDIPEIPLAIDFYEGCPINTNLNTIPHFSPAECETFLVFYLYERPYEKDENEEEKWLRTISLEVASSLSVSSSNIFLKKRKKQKGKEQYEKNETKSAQNIRKIITSEQGQLFLVNLTSYLDTGLFFDHRPLRAQVRQEANNKDILNLFCYTASFSVYAASAKAKSVTSVDLSNTYIQWAKENFSANGLNPEEEKFKFIASDVVSFLKNDKNKYDIIVLDPPTFSNSKKMQEDLDITRDWSELVKLCAVHLNKGGILYFSTNSQRLKFEENLLPPGFKATDITDSTIPEDFRNKKIHRCWKIFVG